MRILFLLITFFGLVIFSCSTYASETNGTIDTTNKYAWSNQLGWINFGSTNSSVAITDSAITGYAWSENYGWINLAPTNSGISNNTEGTLSGQAWGEKIGWVDFSGVFINSAGKFTGTATGDVIGTLTFDCTYCNVSTDWRPASARSSATGGGGGSPIIGPSPSSYSVYINEGATETNSPEVILKLIGDSSTAYVWVSEDSNLVPAKQVFYNNTLGYITSTFTFSIEEGSKTIYTKFCNAQGYCGNIISDSIVYKKSLAEDTTTKPVATTTDQIVVDTSPVVTDPTDKTSVIDKTVDKTKEILKDIATKIDLLIPDFLQPWKKIKEEKLEDVKKFVSQETPLAMRGVWDLLPKDSIKEYVFAPLPDEFKALAKNFPSINSLFSDTGINTYNDLRKLVNTNISVPGLSKVVGLLDGQLSVNDLAKTGGIPLNKLSDSLKQKIPTSVVFTRGASQLVDFGTSLSLSESGRPVQKLKTISNKKLFLSIKPEHKAKSVKGYLTFISRQKSLGLEENNFVSKILSRISVVDFVMASDEDILSAVENKLVLQEFDYNDDDGDGIYTAEIYSPVPEGEYEIITLIEYVDSQYGNKLVRLVTVVDPEGYVYEKIKDKELRISSALVTLMWLNPITKEYELWPADKYQQQNGQITDKRGSYSFLVPAGSYYLQAEASGYKKYKSAPFRVTEGDGVHINIELKSTSWWMQINNWKNWLILLLSVILLYELEQEIKRRKFKKKK